MVTGSKRSICHNNRWRWLAAVNDLQGERTALVDLAQTERERNNLSQWRATITQKHWS